MASLQSVATVVMTDLRAIVRARWNCTRDSGMRNRTSRTQEKREEAPRRNAVAVVCSPRWHTDA